MRILLGVNKFVYSSQGCDEKKYIYAGPVNLVEGGDRNGRTKIRH